MRESIIDAFVHRLIDTELMNHKGITFKRCGMAKRNSIDLQGPLEVVEGGQKHKQDICQIEVLRESIK